LEFLHRLPPKPLQGLGEEEEEEEEEEEGVSFSEVESL